MHLTMPRMVPSIGHLVVVSAFLCASSVAQTGDDPQQTGDSGSYRHIDTSEPRLPNRPPRKENISDDEVREVQQAALEVYPDSIIVISGVTEGCDCEEGKSCTAQVGLALSRDNMVRSLVLSKIEGHWKIGAVQSWWLQYNKNHTEFSGAEGADAWQAWRQKEDRLLVRFPACPLPAASWMLLRNAAYGSTYVDPSSLKVSGFIRRVNFKHESPKPLWKPTPLWTRFGISLEAFDCNDHRERTDTIMFYLENGTAMRGSVEDPVLWNPVKPNTISASDLDLVCGWRVQERP